MALPGWLSLGNGRRERLGRRTSFDPRAVLNLAGGEGVEFGKALRALDCWVPGSGFHEVTAKAAGGRRS